MRFVFSLVFFSYFGFQYKSINISFVKFLYSFFRVFFWSIMNQLFLWKTKTNWKEVVDDSLRVFVFHSFFFFVLDFWWVLVKIDFDSHFWSQRKGIFAAESTKNLLKEFAKKNEIAQIQKGPLEPTTIERQLSLLLSFWLHLSKYLIVLIICVHSTTFDILFYAPSRRNSVKISKLFR